MRTAASALLLSLVASVAFAQGKTKPDANLSKLGQTATAAFQSSDWETAAATYKKIVEITPQDGSAWHRLGYALHAQQKLDEALEAHMKAASLPGAAGLGAYNAACVHALKVGRMRPLRGSTKRWASALRSLRSWKATRTWTRCAMIRGSRR